MKEIDEIRKTHRSPRNRIKSVLHDAEFVKCAADTYKLPLVANKRCGLWYVSPRDRAETCYFKSTDGHTGEWSFSTRRLNLHLLALVQKHGGAIIVDSTRRGKQMPDAQSKTIPVWCAVLNNAVFGSYELHLPRGCVSSSEKDQLNQRIAEWTKLFKSQVPEYMYMHLMRPLRPLWISPDECLPMQKPEFTDFYPLVLCMASLRAQDGQMPMSDFVYVQGAGDDHELWAGSLTPESFWALDNVCDVDLATLKCPPSEDLGRLIQVTPRLFIGSSVPTNNACAFSCVISLTAGQKVANERIQSWPLSKGKKGARELSQYLGEIVQFYHRFLEKGSALVVAESGADYHIGVATMLDCLYTSVDGTPLDMPRKDHVPKEEVNKRLVKVVASCKETPSRTTLNVIGTFLRSPRTIYV